MKGKLLCAALALAALAGPVHAAGLTCEFRTADNGELRETLKFKVDDNGKASLWRKQEPGPVMKGGEQWLNVTYHSEGRFYGEVMSAFVVVHPNPLDPAHPLPAEVYYVDWKTPQIAQVYTGEGRKFIAVRYGFTCVRTG